MVKKINIEVRYVDRDTCSRCKKTGENTEKTYRKLQHVANWNYSLKLYLFSIK